MILADEPTGNLDPAAARNIMDLFKAQNRRGTTVVLITHDENLAREAHRVVRLRAGTIESDSPNEVTAEERVMNRSLAIRQVARSLTRFKGRSVLGGLGIVVSVLATVFVLSAAGTVRGTFDRFVAQLYPTDVITVGSGRGMWAGGGSMGSR